MTQAIQHNTQELKLQYHIATGEGCVVLCLERTAGKGLWISESFNRKASNFRLRSVVWQD